MRWDLVGYPNGHPIPGEPGVVDDQAGHLAKVAEVLRAQSGRLNSCGADTLVWQSGAGDEFRRSVKKLPEDLDKAATRYERVAGAMSAFGPKLRGTRQSAEEGVAEAELAQAQIETAEAGVRSMHDHEQQAKTGADTWNDANPDQPPRDPEPWSGSDWNAQLTEARARLQRARDKVGGAVSSFHGAVDEAKHAVNDARDDDLKNDDSWFGIKRLVVNAGKFVGNHLADISKILGQISAICGLLSLIPIPGLNVVFAAIAVGTAVLQMACDIGLMIQNGTFSLTTLALDVVGVAASAVGLGMAKTASAGLRTAEAGVATTRTSVATAEVARDAAVGRQLSASGQSLTKGVAAGYGEFSKGGKLLTGSALSSRLALQTRTAQTELMAQSAKMLPSQAALQTARAELNPNIRTTGLAAVGLVGPGKDVVTSHTSVVETFTEPYKNLFGGEGPTSGLVAQPIGR